ncbi:MAG: SpoIIE family protein phosphatase [Gammaproteobacteria bacterium]|jgi:sigma-B regulation protein RsbU (phosphoserine phosphatase)|nr:SpoIIE family protein phosphatase [Gammaproteobacteria bacterium]
MNAARLLLIDDVVADRESLAARLRSRGFQVDAAASGAEALQFADDQAPDLILCELHMDDPDGLSMLERLTRDLPDVPLVVVTADSSMGDVMQALRLGAADYLWKPVADVDVLIHAVDSALERSRLRQENSRFKQELEEANRQLKEYVEELQQDQRAGREVQLGMLPPTPMAIDGFRMQHHIIPSLFLSGDFVDYFRITDRHFVFFIADVSGHGASSAFVTVLLKNFSRRLRREYRPRMLTAPGEILRWLNQELLESQLDRHVTMFFGVIDCQDNRLAYANAGHFPAPVMVCDGAAHYLEIPGKPLGLFPDARFASASIELPPSFRLALFSDGVFEVMDEPDLAAKEARLLRSACSAPDMDSLCHALGLAPGLEAPDDVTCLLLSRSG